MKIQRKQRECLHPEEQRGTAGEYLNYTDDICDVLMSVVMMFISLDGLSTVALRSNTEEVNISSPSVTFWF